MANDIRTGLKISGNRSKEMMERLFQIRKCFNTYMEEVRRDMQQ